MTRGGQELIYCEECGKNNHQAVYGFSPGELLKNNKTICRECERKNSAEKESRKELTIIEY